MLTRATVLPDHAGGLDVLRGTSWSCRNANQTLEKYCEMFSTGECAGLDSEYVALKKLPWAPVGRVASYVE